MKTKRKKDYTITGILSSKKRYVLVNEDGKVREMYKTYTFAMNMITKMERKWMEKLKMKRISL